MTTTLEVNVADDKELTPLTGEIVPAVMPELHENLKNVVFTIDNLMAEQHAANILSMWRVGQLLNEIDTNPEKYLTEAQRSQHIAPSALLFRVYDRVYTPDQFASAVRLHDAYPTELDIRALVDKRCPTKPNWRITASHVQLLLTVDDDNKRQVMEERCVKEAYTTKALAVELRELHGKEKKARKPAAPKGLKQRVYDLLEHQRAFISRSEKLWMADDGLYDTIAAASPTQLTDTLKGYIAEIRENFEKLADIVEKHHSVCGKILVHIQNADSGEGADPASAENAEDADEPVSQQPAKLKSITR